MARIAAALARPAVGSRARAALEREALEGVWADAVAAAERKRARERFSAAAADAARARSVARHGARRISWNGTRRVASATRRGGGGGDRATGDRAKSRRERSRVGVGGAGNRAARSTRRARGCWVRASDASSAAAVRKAYKRAALRFHPDRTRALSVAERARGEEVWKALGSKMEAFERTARVKEETFLTKEKSLPASPIERVVHTFTALDTN